MAWLGKVSLGNFPDLAGAVNKLSESVKNIEKNFDTALGFEDKSDPQASGLWPDRKAIFDTFMGNATDETAIQHPHSSSSIHNPSLPVTDNQATVVAQLTLNQETGQVEVDLQLEPIHPNPDDKPFQITHDASLSDVESHSSSTTDALEQVQSHLLPDPSISHEDQDEPPELQKASALQVQMPDNEKAGVGDSSHVINDENVGVGTEPSHLDSTNITNDETPRQLSNIEFPASLNSAALDNDSLGSAVETSLQAIEFNAHTSDQSIKSTTTVDYAVEIDKVKKEMEVMEAALQGAARQAQAKADEIAKLMNENEQLKGVIEDLKRKSSEAEVEVLREEYHQRVSTLERKVYALTRERDTLRREQNKKSDAAALLKEKDEIINQVMAEGEELSKKQAIQESQIRKLRAQIRENEEEKKGLATKLQAEENKVESIKRDKAATEKFLQETIEKHQAELAAQKERFTDALNAAKEAEALAEARANNEARTDLESRLREAGEREATLVQTLEELRQTLTRTEQQAVFREDMLRRDIDDLQKRYQASERRCEELITQVPESTRPLLRQIEAMQETTARRAEAWAGVERALNSRLQEADAKAATAEENERVMNERLSQTLSRVAVLEAQVSCLRAEQTQLTRSLEKERQRASENRQEYLAAQEAVATHQVCVEQLEGEIKELRRKHKQELQELMAHNELLQQEVECEKKNRLDLERTVNVETSSVADPSPKAMQPSVENGKFSMRKLSSSGSISSLEESYFLQASLDSSDNLSERRYPGETNMTPYFLKSMTPNAFEATLRQKDGELASYMSRLASLESIRDSLAEELVKMTAQCEKLRAEAAVVPGMRGELEALRRRHSAALELMGERDEELEELRNDIVDLKEMYREQVNLLVNKIQIMSSSVAA